jgi:hypothetical protein
MLYSEENENTSNNEADIDKVVKPPPISVQGVKNTSPLTVPKLKGNSVKGIACLRHHALKQ